MKRIFAFLLLSATTMVPAHADAAGVVLTLQSPETYSLKTAFNVNGFLGAHAGDSTPVEAWQGLPGQMIEVFVDGVATTPPTTAVTTDQGFWEASLRFTSSFPSSHTIQAVAFGATPIATRSEPHQVRIARLLIGLTISPSNASVAIAGTQALTATGEWDDGRTEIDSDYATWTSSDETVATVSNAAGSRGVVTGVGPGTATITATIDGYSPVGTATVTVS